MESKPYKIMNVTTFLAFQNPVYQIVYLALRLDKK